MANKTLSYTVTYVHTYIFLYVVTQALTVPEGYRSLGSQISKRSLYKGSKVVSPTYRLPLPPGNIPGTHIC
jgi:hypothetical protein